MSTVEGDYTHVWDALRRQARAASYPDGWDQCTACEGTGAADIDLRTASITEVCAACSGRGAVLAGEVIVPAPAVGQGVRSLVALGVACGEHAEQAAKVAIEAAAGELVEANADRVATSELRGHIIAFRAMADVAAAKGDAGSRQVWLDAAEHLACRADQLVERDPYTRRAAQRAMERYEPMLTRNPDESG